MCSSQTDRDFEELIFDQSPTPTLSVAQFPTKNIGCPPRPKFRHEPRAHADGRKLPVEHQRPDGLVFDSSSPFPSTSPSTGRSGIGSSDAPPTRISLSKRKTCSRRPRRSKHRRVRVRRRRVGSRKRRLRGFSKSICKPHLPNANVNANLNLKPKHATFPCRRKSPKLPFPVVSTSKCIRPWFSHKWKYHHIKTLKFEPDARSEIAELQNLGIFRRQSRESGKECEGDEFRHTMPTLGAPVRVRPGSRSGGNPRYPSSAPSTSYSSSSLPPHCSDSDSVLRRDSDLPELSGGKPEDVSLGGSMHEQHRRQQQRRFVEDRVRRNQSRNRSRNQRSQKLDVNVNRSPQSRDRWQRVVFPVVEDEIWGFGFPTLDPFSEERVDDSRLYRMKRLIREKRRNRHFKSVWVNQKSILRPKSIRIGLVAWDEVVRQRLCESAKFKDGILMSAEPSPRAEDSDQGCGWRVDEGHG